MVASELLSRVLGLGWAEELTWAPSPAPSSQEREKTSGAVREYAPRRPRSGLRFGRRSLTLALGMKALEHL